MSLVMHHIIADDWSIDILRREVSAFYTAAINGQDPFSQSTELPIQYRDFTLWEKKPEQAIQQEKYREFWAQQLEGSQPPRFPYDRPHHSELTDDTGQVHVAIVGTLLDDLKKFCRVHQATLFAILLGAFGETHFHLTGMKDATIGILNACRDRQEFEDLIGFFVNLQCIRTTMDSDTSFHDLVTQVQARTTMAFVNQDIPFERIVAALNRVNRDGSQNPLVQTVFNFHPQSDSGQLVLDGLLVEQMDAPRQTKFDMELHLYLKEHGIERRILFAKDLFFFETMEKVVSLFYETLDRGIREE